MGTISVNRLAGLSLIFGPIIAFVFFLIEPGGLLIDSAEVSDAAGTVKAKGGGNAALTNVTNIAIILGLSLILSGLYALMRNVTLQGNGKALAQMGFFMILVGLTGWILASGMDFILADAQTGDIERSVPIYYVGSALLNAGGITLGFGGFIFALGLSTRDDFNQIVSLLAAVVSLAVMVFFVIAILSNDSRDTFISLARAFYVLLVIWYGYLGFGLMKRPDPDLWQ